MNRITVRDYSDTATPDVGFYYDGKYLNASDVLQTATGSVKGKTTGVKSSVSRANNTSFDSMGRVLTSQQITDGQTYPFIYTYNLSGALIEETYPSGRVVKNTLNADGELQQVQSKKNSTSGFWTYADAFSHNAAGAVTKMQLGNGLWETASYDDERLQVTQIGLGTTSSTQNLLKLEFKYEGPSTSSTQDKNNGSMREQKITVPTVGGNAGFTATQTYTYDSINRIDVTEEKISGTTTWKQDFLYDRYGNRRFDAANTTTLGSCSTAICNPTVPTDSTNRNRFSSGQSYSYDAAGSVTQNAQGERFGYDAEGRQKEFFLASNSGSTADATYYYDGQGRRVKKVFGSEVTIFVHDGGGKLVAEYSTTLATTPQVSYLTQDHLGSPRVITNENGVVTDRKDFTAFGEAVASSQRISALGYSTTAQEPRKDFTGYEKDIESGLEFAQARYYNTQHGRFTSVDPLTASATIRNPQTFNRYTYVLNSPYKFVDPLGLAPHDIGVLQTTDPHEARQAEQLSLRDQKLLINEQYKKRHKSPPPPPPSPSATTGQNAAAPPQIVVQSVSVIKRTPKLSKNGDFVIVNGEKVYEESVLSVGSKPQDFSPNDFEVNLNNGEGLLNIGETIYLKVDLALIDPAQRGAFDNATLTNGSVSNISQKQQTDTEISADGQRMSVYSSLSAGADGVGRGKVGTVTLSVRASYVDGYDSTTNRILVPKTASRDIRISLTNIAPPVPNPFLKKPF